MRPLPEACGGTGCLLEHREQRRGRVATDAVRDVHTVVEGTAGVGAIDVHFPVVLGGDEYGIEGPVRGQPAIRAAGVGEERAPAGPLDALERRGSVETVHGAASL